jgi:two-component system CheB/CheR fusion protein
VEGRIAFINPVAAHLTGWPEDEARGRTIGEVFRIVNERTGEPAEDIAMRVLREGRAAALANHTALVTRDGREIPIEDSAAPIRDDDGRVSGVVLVFHDVTAGRRAEEELRQSQAAAEKANQAKSLFLANMSHEIRTPMNGVLGMTDLALMKSTDHQMKEYLGYVKESGLHLLNIINDILDLSRIEAGRIELVRENFSLTNLLGPILEPFRSVFLRRNIDLVLNIDRGVPDRVGGDPGRLRQILVNLIGNALKFTEKGEVVLSVRKTGSIEAQNQLQLLFGVRDTGIGIPSTHLEKIFDSFEQVRTVQHSEFAGTGLGLSISKNLVELMGGTIWVESQEGAGSTFFFTAALETVPINKAEAEKAPESKSAGRSLKILVAEDNRINQLYIETLLKNEGHTVAIAKTGLQALEKLSVERYDLVLMDVRMPEMNGDEAVRLIRNNPPSGVNPKIPVIALTAYALETERERFMECGFDAYLSKPVEIAKLQEILAELS